MATQMDIQIVDVTLADGGLKAVLEMSKVNPLLIDQIAKEGVEDLADFSAFFTQAGYEAETASFRDKVETLKVANNHIDVARLRKAVLLARGVLTRPLPVKETPAPTPDIEAPLDLKEKESMVKAWTMRYHISLSMYLDPADPLVSRLFREFRANTPTLIPVTRMKSVYSDNNPNPEKRVALAGGITMTMEGKEQTEVISNVASYYFALRVLANASAKAGNYEFGSKVEKGTKVIFAPLDTNLDYADHAFRMALKQNLSAWETLKWIEERDLHTRGLMVNFMRGGYPQGEAILKATKETELKWSSPGPHATRGENAGKRRRSRTPQRGTSSTGNGKGAGKKRKLGQTFQANQRATMNGQRNTQPVRYATVAKGGKKICRAFNDGSCKADPCPHGALHICSIIQSGKHCAGKHPASGHRFGNQGR